MFVFVHISVRIHYQHRLLTSVNGDGIQHVFLCHNNHGHLVYRPFITYLILAV